MFSWLWKQICENGEFSIEALSKTVLALVGLLALVVRAVGWFKSRHSAKHAILKLCLMGKGDKRIAVHNCSRTALAEKALLLWWTRCPTDDCDPYPSCAELGHIPPGHTELFCFLESELPWVRRIYVTWQDKTGPHYTTPCELDVLPFLHQPQEIK